MSDAPALFGFRPVPAPGGGTRLEFGPLPTPKTGGKGKKARPAPDPITANPDASAQQLRQYIERYERLEEEKAGIIMDQADVLSEAKAVGFDARTIRKIVALRKIDPNDRAEAEAILETYLAALGIA